MRLVPLIAASSFACTPALAQDQDAQLWLSTEAAVPLTEDLELEFEVQQRFSDDRGGLYESQYLAALTVEIADGITLTGGVNRAVHVSDGRIEATEWRPRQQIAFDIASISSGKIAGRIRLEQRFRSNAGGTGHRLRPEVSYTLPLDRGLELKFAHESYFNFNRTAFQDAGHERMRNSAAITFSLFAGAKAEMGYLNQYRFEPASRDRMEHALTLGLSASI